jgi:hypothetical protein
MKKEKVQYSGWYAYQNNLTTDIVLPFDTKWGRVIRSKGIFQGDSRFNSLPGITCIENLCHMVETTQVKPELEKQLLTETPEGKTLEFFEADGTPINKDEKKEVIDINITKKELLEFAQLKGLKINAFTSKENILKQIREQGKI